MKKRIAVAAVLVLALITACGAFAEPAGQTETGWEEMLAGLDGVVSVEEIPTGAGELFFSEKYLVTFEQQLDWKNPEAGTFPQRVVIGLREGATVNVIGTEGYSFIDMVYGDGSNSMDYLQLPVPAEEPAQLTGANCIQVEHRFFGKSRPEDMSNDDIRYWEYHSAENAAGDYHRIYTALVPLMEGKWIATGSSRGGDMTNAYGYYYPEDMDIYMPYVAPSGMTAEDGRFYPFVFTEIGNAAFGEEAAGEMRGLILSFQVMMLKYKPMLLGGFETAATQQMGCVFRPQTDIGVIYDICVLEFATQFWQYQRISFQALQELMDMPETTPEELQDKLTAGMSMLLQIQGPSDFSVCFWAWPYYVNAATIYGQFHYDFSFLRQALKDAGAENTLSVTEDMENGLIWDTVFTEEQKAAFTYDGSYRKAMLEDMKTTNAKHLMIFGATDPWITEGITECENPNVRIFIHPTRPHDARISTMPEDIQAEAIETLREWISP